MVSAAKAATQDIQSLSSRRAWIEMWVEWWTSYKQWSLSSRRAWIEISRLISPRYAVKVALLTESVDWNPSIYQILLIDKSVALLTESVDWNLQCCQSWLWYYLVALLTESVDWNWWRFSSTWSKFSRSPHGERGLKFDELNTDTDSKKSLSSRRAWIEIWAE